MASKKFLIEGNLCGDRVRIGRAIHKPALTQEDLARGINLLGMEMTPLIISGLRRTSATSATGSW